jgi:hypothetical protein
MSSLLQIPPLPSLSLPSPPPVYNFSLDLIQCSTTRSRGSDTIFASTSVAIAGRDPFSITKKLGDHNDGSFNPEMVLGNVPVADDEVAVFSYVIVNSGHGDDSFVEKTINEATTKLAKKGADAAVGVAVDVVATAVGAAVGSLIGSSVPVVGTIVGAALGALAGKLLGDLIDIINPNCDGPLAAGTATIIGQNLREQLDVQGQFGHQDTNPGIDSPSGCGDNSEYKTSWSVKKA